MKVFKIVKRPLCLGLGDAPLEWEFIVRAKKMSDVKYVLDQSGICQVGITIHEIYGKELRKFAVFLHSKT